MARSGKRFSVGSTKPASPAESSGILDEVLDGHATPLGIPTEAPLSHVALNPANPRRSVDEEYINELAASMQEKGQLQPALVTSRDLFTDLHPEHSDAFASEVRWVVIAGSQRRLAAERAELETFKFVVSTSATSAVDVLEDALIENIQRSNLSPLDEAYALSHLVGKHGSQNKVGKRLGKTGAWVSQRLSLLNLTPELQDALNQRALKVEDARRIGRLPAEEQVQSWEELKQRTTNGVNTENDDAIIPTPDPSPTNGVNGHAGASPQPVDPPNPAPADNDVNVSGSKRAEPSPKEPPTNNDVNDRQQPEQLMLNLQWEPRTMAERLRAELGAEKFSQLMEAGLELTS